MLTDKDSYTKDVAKIQTVSSKVGHKIQGVEKIDDIRPISCSVSKTVHHVFQVVIKS